MWAEQKVDNASNWKGQAASDTWCHEGWEPQAENPLEKGDQLKSRWQDSQGAIVNSYCIL